MYLYNISLGRLLNKQTPEHVAWEANTEQDGEKDETSAALDAAVPANANGEARKRRSKR